MALSADQQSQLEFQTTLDTARNEAQAALEATRHANTIEIQNKQAKSEAVRLAKEVLIENARSKSVDERDVTVSDITTFANTLHTYMVS